MTEPAAYIISNNQEEYAYLGAKWLFETLGGKGDVVYMRGAAGASADTDRDKGFKRALAEFPDVKVVQEIFTGWQQDQGKQQILDYIATGLPFDGIWTSGIDNVIVDALVESGATLVPVVGADNAGFVGQLNSVEGLKGAAVTNPGSIGGAGVTLARAASSTARSRREQTVLVQPELWENVTDEGKAKLAGRRRPVPQPRVAGLDLDPRLDDLHQGADRRLQGPGRKLSPARGWPPNRPIAPAAATALVLSGRFPRPLGGGGKGGGGEPRATAREGPRACAGRTTAGAQRRADRIADRRSHARPAA